jgi:hypothetical protein
MAVQADTTSSCGCACVRSLSKEFVSVDLISGVLIPELTFCAVIAEPLGFCRKLYIKMPIVVAPKEALQS